MESALLIGGWLVGWLLLWRIPLLRAEPTGDACADPARGAGETLVDRSLGEARVSVIIPARDEEHNLPTLLASLQDQSREPAEIIVVDDGSTDGTARVAQAGDARVLPAGDVPEGWTGKSWACSQGVEAASGDLLVLLDADVTLAPDALDALVRRHARGGGLLSVQPYHLVRRPYEWLSAVFNIMAFMGVGAASLVRPRRLRAAFGPCLVCHRDDYDAVGGHRSVRGEIVEDVALGRRFADAGLGVTVLGGRDTVTFRMYPDGLRRVWEGWAKNIASGAASSAVLRAAGGFLWVTAALLAGGLAVGAAIGSDDVAPAVAIAVYAAFVVQFAVQCRQVGSFPILSWLFFPVLFVFFVAVFVRSLVSSVFTRRVVWRGRTIPLARSRRWVSSAHGTGAGT